MIAAGIATGAGFFLWGHGDASNETMAVHPGEFIQQISVAGKVVPAENVDLAFSTGGRIAAVHATVGDRVARGHVLALVENGDLAADITQKRAVLEAARTRLLSTQKGTRPEEIAVIRSSVASADVSLAAANRELADAVRAAYTQADDAVRRRVDQLMSNAGTVSPQLNFQTSDSRLKMDIETSRVAMEKLLVQWKADVDVLLSSGETNAAARAEIAARNLTDVRGFLDKTALAVNALTPTASFSQTTIDGYRADISTARANISTTASALASAETKQKNAVASLATAHKNLELQEAGATAENIAERQADVEVAEAELQRAQAQYAKTLVVAPFPGIVTRMDAKIGGSAASGASAISLISDDMLEIESFIPEIQAPLVHTGNEAAATLDAYGAAVFASRVVSVDPAETIRDGVSTYRAIMQFLGRDERVRPGVTAHIVITTEKKANVISIPQEIVITRDGKHFVPIADGDRAVEREVETGSVSSFGTIEITAGLHDGDIVRLKGQN